MSSDSQSAPGSPTEPPADDPILRVENLKKYYPLSGGIFKRRVGEVKAVDGVSFEVQPEETFAVVGESGCGKTTLGKTIIRLLEPTSGRIEFEGTDITNLGNRDLRSIRRDVSVVYQDPTSSLNPRKRIKDIIADPLKIHGIGTKEERQNRVAEVIERVNLSSDFLYRYPNALSGGEKQRVAIARALVINPTFVLLDEPTSALDVSVQAKIIALLRELQDELGLTYVIISHDLSLVKNIADRIGVMYLGKFMEIGSNEQLFENPVNPYTEQLLSAIPVVDDAEEQLKPSKIAIRGEPPDPKSPPDGCSFHPRCHKGFGACDDLSPELVEYAPGHQTRCLLAPGAHDEAVRQYLTPEERRSLLDQDGASD